MKTITLTYQEAKELSIQISGQVKLDEQIHFVGLLTETIKESVKRRLTKIYKALHSELELIKENESEEALNDTFELSFEPVSELVYDFVQTKDVKMPYNYDLIDKIVE